MKSKFVSRESRIDIKLINERGRHQKDARRAKEREEVGICVATSEGLSKPGNATLCCRVLDWNWSARHNDY